ncbi:MAG: hypothetical protein ACKOXM_01620 [Agromyces sp.]
MRTNRVGLEPRYFLTWPVFAGTLVWQELAHFLNTGDNGVSYVTLRAVLVILVHLIHFGIPAGIANAVQPLKKRWLANTLVITGVIVGGIVRGVLFAWLLYITGVTATAQWELRIAVSITQGTVVFLAIWIGVSGVSRQLEYLRALNLDRARLQMLQAQAVEQYETLDVPRREDIRARILQSLELEAPAKASQVLERLQYSIREVVRPLNKQLEAETSGWHVPRPEPESLRISWLEVLKNAMHPRQIAPFLIPFALVILALPTWMLRGGVALGLYSGLLGVVFGTVTFWLTKLAATAIASIRPGRLAALSYFAAVVVSGEVLGIVGYLSAAQVQIAPQILLFAPMYALLVATAFGFARSAMQQAYALEVELRDAASLLRWQISRARELYRQRYQAVAHALHGKVQVAIAAGIMQLELAAQKGEMTDELGAEVHCRITESVRELDLTESQALPLPDLAENIRASWDGVASVTFDGLDTVQDIIASDEVCLKAVNDVIPELVFNAIKHGATPDIVLTPRIGDRTLELTVVSTDREVALPAETSSDLTAGIGTRLLEECALSWERSTEGNVTKTVVVLPIEPDASSTSAAHRLST